MKKKIVWSILAGVISVSMLSGCSIKSKDVEEPNSDNEVNVSIDQDEDEYIEAGEEESLELHENYDDYVKGAINGKFVNFEGKIESITDSTVNSNKYYTISYYDNVTKKLQIYTIDDFGTSFLEPYKNIKVGDYVKVTNGNVSNTISGAFEYMIEEAQSKGELTELDLNNYARDIISIPNDECIVEIVE